MKFEHTWTGNWENAFRGLRHPMESYAKSDSDFGTDTLGENDYKLAMKLAKAGTDHRKFMRMINVTVDITTSLYWWKEFDTYKVGTVSNSTSTMHKIHAKKFTLDDFSTEHLMDFSWNRLDDLIEHLNWCREKFIETKDKDYWWQMIQLLPSSYNQKRTIQLNYEVLANIYKSRRNHKLDEWRSFCKWIEGLPYGDLITECQTETSKPNNKEELTNLFNKMRKIALFNGIYDARGKGSEHYMHGIGAVMEYIAYSISDKCGDEFSTTFINNMIESERKAELTKKTKKKKGWWRR